MLKLRNNKRRKTQKTKRKMAEVSPSFSVATLNVNKLNCAVKRKKREPTNYMLPTRNSLNSKDTNRLKVKNGKRYLM